MLVELSYSKLLYPINISYYIVFVHRLKSFMKIKFGASKSLL